MLKHPNFNEKLDKVNFWMKNEQKRSDEKAKLRHVLETSIFETLSVPEQGNTNM